MRLYLIRHPEPEVAPGICYGQSDIGLAADAAASAARLHTLLPDGAAIYSSPLRRCRDLAQLLHPTPIFDDRLKEIHFGDWEMRAWDDIARAEIDAWAAATLEHAPPGGESVAMLYTRVAQFIRERHDSGEDNLVMVTHAGVMKACCALLLNLPQAEWMSLKFDYGSVVVIEDGELRRVEQPS